MTILGIGPSLVLTGALATFLVLAIEKITGCTLTLPESWHTWALWPGVALLLVGIYFWIASALQVKRAFATHQLAQSGVYALSRNPMYAGFILFIIPGLALISNHLLLLAVSLSILLVFKMRVGKEEEYLRKEFGEAYRNYQKRVPQLTPLIQFHSRPTDSRSQ